MINWPQQVCFTRTALSRKGFCPVFVSKLGGNGDDNVQGAADVDI